MKVCTKCSVEKSLEEFWKHKRSSDGRQAWCKTCSSIRRTLYYRENREHESSLRETWNEAYRQWYISLKEGKPCSKCKNIYFHAAMHWHHVDDNKDASVADLARHRASKAKVLAEIAKCELWCAICHAEHTWSGEVI